MVKKTALLLTIYCLSINSLNAQIVPVTGISTNFNGYWATTITTNNSIQPNNSHELLSFTYNGVRYSTGVNDATLTANNASFTAGNYRALPIAGILGNLASNTTATLLAMASLKDGNPTQGVSTHPNINGKTIRNVLIDGARGLDLGTGVTNLPSSSVMSFGIFSIKDEAIADPIPDILITQIAAPAANTDTYAFYNSSGVLVGNTVTQVQSTLTQLGEYRLDLFSLTAGPLTNATPYGNLFETANGTRPIRLSAYKLSDFGITVANASQIAEFRIVPSGSSDLAFVGYNASAINFKPAISPDPGNSVSTVCSGGTAILKVIATPANDGTLSYQWQEKVGANPFTNIANGGAYTGVTTDELRVTNPISGVQYRCIVTEASIGLTTSSTSSTFTIAISAIGNPTISTQPANVSNCAGTPYNIFVIPSGGTGVYSYQWQSGTSATGPWTNINGATESNLSGIVASPGPAWFRVVVSNDGCNGSVNSNVSTITTTGAGTVLTTTNVERCGQGTVTLTASSSNGGTFSWKNGLGVEVGTLSSYTTPSLAVSTDYFVTATTSGCTTPANTVTATIKANYRTSANGLWDDLDGNPATTIWQVQASDGSWVAAPVNPAQGTPVNILHEVTQNVDFTVENCPLTLVANGAGKLIINPDISLKFAGGADGNAYFNNRPVVVRSTVNGTGAIGAMLVNSKTFGDENVQLERFLPDQKRRWNLLTPGVINGTTINTSTTLRDAWAGGIQDRVKRSNNRAGNPVYQLGKPPGGKPENLPYPLYASNAAILVNNPVNSGYDATKYTPYTGTIITGHRNTNGSQATPQGFDWWDELIIPAGATFFTTPNRPIVAISTQTTPSSIRPYRPNATSDFGPDRGTQWVSNNTINNDPSKGGRSIVQLTLNELENGYMLFTRGDRRVLENWFDSTTLRPVGKIRSGDVQFTVKPGVSQALTVMPNPYPAPISLEKLYADVGANNGIAMLGKAHVWYSSMNGANGYGGWITLIRLGVNDWVAAPLVTGTNPQIISSSQAFMVEGTPAGGTLTYKERMKVDITTVDFLPFENEGSNNGKIGLLSINLNNRSSSNGKLSIVDGVGILLDNKYTTGTTDVNDVKKVFNFEGGRNLCLLRNGSTLSFDAYPEPTAETVFPLQAKEIAQAKYAFTFTPKDLEKDGREAWMKDKFLGTETPISLTSTSQYDFEGNADAASLNADRFEIVFKQGEVLPVTLTSARAYKKGTGNSVEWSTAGEVQMKGFEIEKNADGRKFTNAVFVDAKNGLANDYYWFDAQPFASETFYRVKSLGLNGSSTYSSIMRVKSTVTSQNISIFPNPVPGTNFNVEMNGLSAGTYVMLITNAKGEVILSRNIEFNGGNQAMNIRLGNAALPAGVYLVNISKDKETVKASKLIFE